VTPYGDSQALGELLRSRRERLAPADVGLAPGERRRTAGLRREEVALLANLSTAYYTFLEQGRPVHPSPRVLDSLARALQLSAAEREYLQRLSRSGTAAAEEEWLDPGVIDFVDRLDPSPSLVKGRWWDVLVANDAARELFADWGGDGDTEPNLVRWMFTTERAQQVYIDWEYEAKAMLGRFRLAAAAHPDDAATARLVEQLQDESELVRRWWPLHDVTAIGGGTKRLRHPRFGPTEYRHVVLAVADNPDQRLVSYSPT
jgi:transcriptional regulator with XRE-family HTH domain